MISRERYRRLISFILTFAILLTTVTSSVVPVYANEKGDIVEEVKQDEGPEEELQEDFDEPVKEEVEETIIEEIGVKKELPLENIKFLNSDTASVKSWEEFRLAYNNQSINKIELTNDIITDNIKNLTARTAPLIISGDKGNQASVDEPYYLLEIGKNELPLGKPNREFQEFRLENLNISNMRGSYSTTKGGFLSLASETSKSYSWTLYFKNIKNPKKRTDSNYADMVRFAVARSSTFIFEGNIDVEMFLEYGLPGNVLIKRGTNFVGNQHNTSDRDGGAWQHSAFWYNSGSPLLDDERSLVVEDDVKINWTRTNTSNYPPIYSHYKSIEIGDNVEWKQDNFKYFLLNDATPYDKKVKFGTRNNIIAINSSNESINFTKGKSYIEFGPGSSLMVYGEKDLMKIGNTTSVLFRNPVGLDLESNDGKIFNIAKGGSVEFRYVTMNVWKDIADKYKKPDETFRKIKSGDATETNRTGVIMTSDNEEAEIWFNSNNPEKITTEKVPVGDVEINYINHKTNKSVGNYRVGSDELWKEFGKTADYEFLVDEEFLLTEKMKSEKVPQGYTFATDSQLNASGKTQTKYVRTGMKKEPGDTGKDIEDPRITDVYVHPENVEFKINYKYVEDGKTVRTEVFSEENGNTVNLNTPKYTSNIYDGFRYAKDEELKEGQVQGKEILVEKDKEYEIYIVKTNSKGGIWGRVIDRKTNEGVPKARVRVPGANEEVLTDKNGYYIIIGLDSGKYSVIASHEKYNSTSDLLEVSSEMVYKDFFIDKNKDSGGETDKYLIYGRVEAVEGGISSPAKGAEVTTEITHKGVADSFGYYVINDIDGDSEYSLLANYTGFSSKTINTNVEKEDLEVNFLLYAGFTIDVVGKTGSKEHYRYTIQTSRSAEKFSVTALPVKDYILVNTNENTIEVNPSTHPDGKDIVFEYKYNMANIKIESIYRDGANETVIGEFTDIGQIGTYYKWEKTKPNIEGYTYNSMDDPIKVAPEGNVFRLYYKKTIGNLKVNAIEKLVDGTTNIIGSVIRPIKIDETYKASEDMALDVSDVDNLKNYNLIRGDEYIGQVGTKEFTYLGSGLIPEVFYVYEKKTENISVKAIDIKSGKEILVNTPQIKVPIEENVVIIAPELADEAAREYRLVGDSQKIVYVKNGEKNKIINFYYEKIERELVDINVRLFYEENGQKLPFFNYKIPGELDRSVSVTAPTMTGWNIKGEDVKSITPKKGELNEIEFLYEKDTLSIDLKLVTIENGIEKDIKSSLPEGAETIFKVLRGSEYTIFAPQIPGYVLVKDEPSFKKFTNIQEDKTVKFIYQPISEVVDEYTVDINAYGVDEFGNELYSYRINRPKNSGSYEVSAFKQLGYEISGEGSKIVNVKDGDLKVEFRYKSLDQLIKIIAIDENNQTISDYTEIKIIGQKNSPFSYNAPYIKGWNLNDDITKVIDKVDEFNNEITFRYKKSLGNIEIILKEEDGRIIKTLSDNVTVADGEKTIKAPSLETYTLVGESQKIVKYSEEKQIVEFIYKKEIRDIIVNHYDVSIDGEEKLIAGQSYKLEGQRVGEVIKVSAKNIENFYLIGDITKLVNVEAISNQEIRFDYKSKDEENIVVNAVEKGTNTLLQSTNLKVEKGEVIKVDAPTFDSHKLSAEEINPKTAKSGDILVFKYDKNVVKVKIEAKDKKGNKLELYAGTQGEFEAVKGKDFIAYAPHIPGYVLVSQDNSTFKFNKIAKDETANFVYKPISEVVDEYTVDINVKGQDKFGNELYSYRINRAKDSGKYTVNAFNLSGYKLVGSNTKEVVVLKTDIQIVFEYESLDRLVTIRAVDENNQALTDFTEIKVMSQDGNRFSYNAPYVKGWNLNDSITKNISVSERENTITFKYKKAEGNVEILLKEDNGRVIKTLSDSVTVGNKKNIIAPNLSGEAYTLVSANSIEVEYKEEKQIVEFIYKKDMREVEINLYDISSGEAGKQLIKTEKLGNFRVGEVAKIIAPSVEDMALVGDKTKLVEIKIGEEAQKVEFNYKSVLEDEIIVEAVEKETGMIIQLTSVKVDKGTSLKINAPRFDSHKLSLDEEGIKTVKSGEKAVFKYDKNVVKVKIEAKDKKGNKLELYVGTQGEFEAVKEKDFIAYAPHIPGYVLVNQDNSTVKFNKIARDETANFVYKPISEVVDEYTVDINVKGQDKFGNELYSYRINRAKDSGKYTVNAFNLSGYKLVDSNTKEVVVLKNDIQIVFEYESLDRLVTIRAVDENNQVLIDFTEIKVMSQDGNRFSYNAPYVEGWNLNDSITKNISVSETENTITFKYKKAEGNIEIILKEDNGNIISSYSETVTVGEKKTIEARDLTSENYTLIRPDKIEISFKEEKQVVEFIYKKDLREVKFEIWDISDPLKEVQIGTAKLVGEFRIGEVAKIQAPSIENMILMGNTVELVMIDGGAGAQVVRFNYQSTKEDKIIIEAIEKETGFIIQSTILDARVGSSIKVTAPKFESHKLSMEEQEIKTVKAGEKAVFKYDKNVVKVKIEAKDNRGNKLELYAGTQGEFEAVKGKDFIAYAPHIPGYVLVNQDNSTVKFNKIAKDEIANFVYKPISEVVDEYTVDINIKAIDEKDNELYSYRINRPKNSGKYEVKPVSQSGFKLVAKQVQGKEVIDDVELDIKEEDIFVVFRYKSLGTKIKILAADENNIQIASSDYTAIEVNAVEGEPFSYNAPYIRGWNLDEVNSTKTIEKVDENTKELKFKYKKASGNVEIILRGEDGGIIKSISDSVDKNGKTIKAPDLFSDYYTFISKDGYPKEVHLEYSESKQTVEFFYKKDTKKLLIKAKDITNGRPGVDISYDSDYIVEGPIGEAILIKAKPIENMELVGDSDKFYIIRNTDNQTVYYDYKSLEQDEITVEAIDVEDNSIIQETVIASRKGTSMKIKAPNFRGYKLKLGELPERIVESGSKVTFLYEKDLVEVQLNLKDGDKLINVESGIKTRYKVSKNTDHTVYAPHIPNYIIIGISKVEIENIQENKVIEFKYKKIEEVVEDYMVKVTIEGKTDSNLLYSYVVARPKNSGKFRVEAMHIPGYKIGEKTKEIDIKENNETIEFKYVSLETKVSIVAIDETGNPIPEYTVEEKNAIQGKPFTHTAPYIPGYVLVGTTIGKIDEVKEEDNLIKFVYKKSKGNVVIMARENDGNGNIIRTAVTTVEVNENHTIKVNEISEFSSLENDYFKLKDGESEKTIKITGTEEKPQVVEFYYEKIMLEPVFRLWDITDEANKKVISNFIKPNKKYRAGEVANIEAPSVDGMYIVGDSYKLIIVGNATEVEFNYKSLTKKEIKIEAREGSATGPLIKEVVLVAQEGTTLDVTAPEFATHKLVGEKVKKVKAGETVVFIYAKNTVKIELDLVDKENNNLSNLLDTMPEIEIIKGTKYTVNAPYVPGYIPEKKSLTFTEDQTRDKDKLVARFLYRPISELVDNYTITISVRGLDQAGNELYSYKVNRPENSGKYTVTAFDLLGYELKDKSKTKEVDIKKSDVEVVFEYKSLDRLVKIKAVDENNLPIVNFAEIRVMSQDGNRFSYNAPYIKGWNLNDSITKNIIVSEIDNTITFEYKKAEGNVEVILKEDDGRIIRTESKTVTINKPLELVAPSIDTYSIVGDNKKILVYSEEKQIVEFIYKKHMKKIEIQSFDISDSDNVIQIGTGIDAGEFRVGEVARITAPSRNDMILVGSPVEIIVVENGLDTQIVRFNYKSTKEGKITIEAVEKETGLIIQTVLLDTNIGSSVKVNAPIFDTHKLSVGETAIKVVKAGEKVRFEYDKNVVKVKIEAKDKKGNKLELYAGTQGEFEAVKGKDFIAYAPHIPGYVLVNQDNSTFKFNKIAKDETANFVYKPISEVVDEYTVDINVKGQDKFGNELYSYRINRAKDSGKYTVNAFNLSGYKLVGSNTKEVVVLKNDIQIVFEYESLDRLVTIRAADENNQALTDFTEIKVMSQDGNRFSYNAPYVKGWNLNDSITKNISVSERENTITFKYKKAEGNVEIVLKEDNGRVIKTLSDSVTVGNKKNIIAPNLSGEAYTLVSANSIEVEYKEEKQIVEFIYKKDMREVEINLYDISSGEAGKQLIKTEKLGNFRVGEVAKIIAPSVEDMALVGDKTKLVEIKIGEEAQKVEFNYKSVLEDEIIVEAVEKETGMIIQSTSVKVDKGTSLKINAPRFDSHKLSLDEEEIKTVKSGEKAVFKYDKNVVKVKIEAKDKKGNKLELYVGTQGEFEAVKEKDFIAYAPHIPGYVLVNQDNSTVKFNKIARDETANFVYKPISEVVDEYTVDINVKGLDSQGNELYSYLIKRPKNSGEYIVNAFIQKGYEIVGDSTRKIIVGDTDQNIEFKYKSTDMVVVIKMVDESGSALVDEDGNLVENIIATNAVKNSSFSYNAPYIKGWNLISSTIGKIDRVTEEDNIIEFKYKKSEGNILVVAKEGDTVIKTESITGNVGDNIVVNSLDLSGDYYKLKDLEPASKTVRYTDELQEIVFQYEKLLQDIELELYDITEVGNEVLIQADRIIIKDNRIGETVKLDAPSLDGYYLIGDKAKLVIVEKKIENQKVRFDYKKLVDSKAVVIIKYITNKGEVLRSFTADDKKVGDRYTHSYPATITSSTGKVYDTVNFNTDTITVDSDISNNIMLFIYSDSRDDKTGGSGGGGRSRDEKSTYVVEHIYKDKDGKTIDIIRPIIESGKDGQEVDVKSSSKVDENMFRLISKREVTIVIGKDKKVIFEYELIEKELYKHDKYIEGYKDNTVRPEQSITREEVAAIIYRTLDEDMKNKELSKENPFIDVNEARWSYDEITYLIHLGVIEGYKDNTFKPQTSITRAEAITMIVRLKGANNSGEITATDSANHWAEDYINIGLNNSWIEGYPDGSFRPQNNITRAEFINMMNNMLNRKTKKENMITTNNEYLDLSSSKWYYEAVMEATRDHFYKIENKEEVWIKNK